MVELPVNQREKGQWLSGVKTLAGGAKAEGGLLCVCVCVNMTKRTETVMWAGLWRGYPQWSVFCTCMCVCVYVCVCVLVSRSQSLTPPWQVCGPSPPPTSPSAACPWPVRRQETQSNTQTHNCSRTLNAHVYSEGKYIYSVRRYKSGYFNCMLLYTSTPPHFRGKFCIFNLTTFILRL